MESDELNSALQSLMNFSLMQAGRVEAHRSVIDALLGTIGLNMPALLGQFAANLQLRADMTRGNFSLHAAEFLQSYDAAIEDIQESIKVLKKE